MNFSRKHRNLDRQLGEYDKVLYELGLVALGIGIASVLLYIFTDFSVLYIKYRCVFNSITGLPCPGCGGTRSARALVKGDVLTSLYYYPPLLYGLVVYVVFMVRCALFKYLGIKKCKDGTVVKFIYVFVALILIQWIVKIVAQVAFGYNWFG